MKMTDNLNLATMILSDCGIAAPVSIEEPHDLRDRIAKRIDLYTAKVIKEALKQRDEERDSLIHMQDIAIEQKDAEIAQLRDQLAAYEAAPIYEPAPDQQTVVVEQYWTNGG